MGCLTPRPVAPGRPQAGPTRSAEVHLATPLSLTTMLSPRCPWPHRQVASQDVSDLTHGLLVQAIKAAGSPLKLQVAAVQQPAPAARPQQAASGAAVKPVSIMINKGPKGFGMNLSRMGDDHVFRVVDPGGPAALAGAHPGDVIVEVAGKSVRGLDHKQLVDIIRPLQAVQMLLIPSLGRSGQALPKTEEHVWNQVRQKAQSVVAGQALAAEERARLDEQNRRELEQAGCAAGAEDRALRTGSRWWPGQHTLCPCCRRYQLPLAV